MSSKNKQPLWPNLILILGITVSIVLSGCIVLTRLSSPPGAPRYPNATAIQECDRPFIELDPEPGYSWSVRIYSVASTCFTSPDTREQIDQWYQQQPRWRPGWGYISKGTGSAITITSYRNRFINIYGWKQAVTTTNGSENGLTKITMSTNLILQLYLH